MIRTLSLFLLVVAVRDVSSADMVPEREKGAIVSNIVRMVIVMDIGARTEGEVPKRTEPEVIATVAVNSLQYSND